LHAEVLPGNATMAPPARVRSRRRDCQACPARATLLGHHEHREQRRYEQPAGADSERDGREQCDHGDGSRPARGVAAPSGDGDKTQQA
jgi:hypothetical protein